MLRMKKYKRRMCTKCTKETVTDVHVIDTRYGIIQGTVVPFIHDMCSQIFTFGRGKGGGGGERERERA